MYNKKLNFAGSDKRSNIQYHFIELRINLDQKNDKYIY